MTTDRLVKMGAAALLLSSVLSSGQAQDASGPQSARPNRDGRVKPLAQAAGRANGAAVRDNSVFALTSRSLPYLNPIFARRNSSPALVGGTDIFSYGVPKGGDSFVNLLVDLSDLSETQKACQYWLISGEQFCGDDGFMGGPSANRGLTNYTIETTRDGKTWTPAALAAVPAELRLTGNTVVNNTRRTTCHAFDLRGMTKARVKITSGRGWQNGQCGLNLNIYDAASRRTLADWQAIDGVIILGDSTATLPLQYVTDYAHQIATPAHPRPPVYAFGQPYSKAFDFVQQADFYNEVLREKQGRFIVLVTGANDVPNEGWLASTDTLIKRNRAAGKVTMVCLPLYPNGPAVGDGGAPSQVRKSLDALYGGKPLVQHLRDLYAGQSDVIISDALAQWSRKNPGVMRPNDLHESDTDGWKFILANEIKTRFFEARVPSPLLKTASTGGDMRGPRR